MERGGGNGERMRKWREIHTLHFLILSLFLPSLSISYIKICHILSQNVKYGTFVANVTKKSTYAIWGNNSGSNSLRGSSASCTGLFFTKLRDDTANILFLVNLLRIRMFQLSDDKFIKENTSNTNNQGIQASLATMSSFDVHLFCR